MGVTVLINIRSVNKIGLAVNPNREVTTFAFHFKLALTAGSFYNPAGQNGLLCFFRLSFLLR